MAVSLPWVWRRKVWQQSVGQKISGITGPMAPHSFLFTQRQHLPEFLGSQTHASVEIDEQMPQLRHGEDVLCVIKHHMRDAEIAQVVVVLPAGTSDSVPPSPLSVASRKAIPEELQRQVCTRAKAVREQNIISNNAEAYLTNWVTGQLRHHPRPSSYPWLQHRWDQSSNIPRPPMPYYSHNMVMSRMVVKPMPHARALQREHENPVDDNSDDQAEGVDGQFVVDLASPAPPAS